ncbi:MAG TPA: 3-dehydroquinate dehydratase, partial [Lachnospiraceae bacterium]|nr:3-dehydroquinate dehydratase [Lachnospiraceae bacterium]
TRAAAAFTGSCVSFGTAGMMSAPGQISAGALRTILQELN